MDTWYDNAAFANFVAAISHTNSNWFQFVQLIAATKLCRSDKDLNKLTVSHKANCCGDMSPLYVAAIYRLVCLGLNSILVSAPCQSTLPAASNCMVLFRLVLILFVWFFYTVTHGPNIRKRRHLTVNGEKRGQPKITTGSLSNGNGDGN